MSNFTNLSKNNKNENFADTQTTSSTSKTLIWISVAIFFICLIVGLIYFIKSQKLNIDFTQGFKSNLQIPGL